MSQTPIYDELRESRISSGAPGTSGGSKRAALRLQTPSDTVSQLMGRQGLGGRHRRPAE